jgi:hypothetical protein
MTNKFNSDYQMFSYGPSKALKCLRYLLRNPDADARTTADACKTSYNVAWAARTDIKKHGREVMIPIAKLDVQDPTIATLDMLDPISEPSSSLSPAKSDPRIKFEVLDVLTSPDLDDEALVSRLRELGFERVTASTEETNECVLEPQVTETPLLGILDSWDDDDEPEIKPPPPPTGISRVLRSKNYIPKPQEHKTPRLEEKLESNARVSDGSTARYYELPDGAKELQDLISHKNMNSQMGEIFRATYRYGESSHSSELRDAKKIRFYIDAEIKRLGG